MTQEGKTDLPGQHRQKNPGPVSSPVQLGMPLHLVSRSRPLLEYHLYLPGNQAETGRVLVTVHGVSRNAEEHIELLRELSDAYGVMLVAPVFEAEVYHDHQRLGRKGIGPRADLALIRLLNAIGRHTGAATDKEELNRARTVRRTQGRHRVERAQVWTNAMNAVAERVGLPPAVEMVLLPGVAHSFRQAVEDGSLGHRLYEHCYGARPAGERESKGGRGTMTANDADWQGLAPNRQPI